MTTTEIYHKEYRIDSKRENVPLVVARILEDLQKKPDINGCDCVFDIKVVLNELIANAVIHGNKENKKTPVEIDVYSKGDSIVFEILDRGCRFIVDKPINENLHSENNRGTAICRVLCKKLKYSYIEGKGNSVKAVFLLENNKEEKS